MAVFMFDNILDVMNKFDEYKLQTQSKWLKIDARGPLFLAPGKETIDCIEHATVRATSNVRFLNWSKFSIVNDGTPYVPIGKHVYACYYGRDPSRFSKLKKRSESLNGLSEKERTLLIESKDNSWEWNVAACPARVRLSYIIKFPDMKTNVPDKRKNMTRFFDEMMRTNPGAIKMKNLYILEFSYVSAHSSHPCPVMDQSFLNKRDRAMLQAVEWYSHSNNDTPLTKVIGTMDNSDDSTDTDDYASTSTNIEPKDSPTLNIKEDVACLDTDSADQAKKIVINNIRATSGEFGRKRSRETDETSLAIFDELHERKDNVAKRKATEHDADDYFLLSLSPRLKTLPRKKASEIKIKFLQLLHEAEFD